MEMLKLQISDTFKSMKEEGLVDDHFMYVYTLKNSIDDHFYLEMIPQFCCNVRDTMKLISETMNDETLNFKLMKEYVFKVKGSAASFGASRMVEAFTNFQRAIDAASKEECLKALNRAKREVSALEEKLHVCLQLERRIVNLATQGANM